jgi:hypothetical protein
MLRKKLTQSRWGRLIPLAAVLPLVTGNASAQSYPNVPSGDQRRALILQQKREQERQKKLDDAYKAATRKIPNQKPNDPWGDVRPTPTVPLQKK